MRPFIPIILLAMAPTLVSCGATMETTTNEAGQQVVICEIPGDLGNKNVKPKKKVSRDDVQSAMRELEDDVKLCGSFTEWKSKGDIVTVKYVVEPEGYVSSAAAVYGYANTKLGRCAAGKICKAKFPVAENMMTISYPFKL